MAEPDTASRPDGQDSDNERVLRSFQKGLSTSGGGSGVSLHIDADLASELHLDSNTEVKIDVVEKDGDVNLRISDIPAGFTLAALREYAERIGWTETDSYVAEDEWSLTYRDPTELVRVEVDSTTHIDDAVVNNVFIQGEPVDIGEDLERYRDLCVAATRKDLRVRVRDSEGLWQRLHSSADHDTDDAPDESTFQQLLKVADSVQVQLVKEMASLNTTLEEISGTVNDIRAVMEEHDVGKQQATVGSSSED